MGDEGKRKQYDTFGMASNGDQSSSQGFGQGRGGFQYQSQVDPEELFRTIFGDAFRSGRNPFESFFDGSDEREDRFEPSQVNKIIYFNKVSC